MSYLVRKIARAKWPNTQNLSNFNIDNLKADAISSCLRTQKDTLSIWEIDSLSEIDDAALALVSSSEHLDGIFMVSIDKNLLTSQGLQLIKTPGNTPVLDLQQKHHDVYGLTYNSIGKFAHCIIEALNQQSFTHKYTKGQLKNLLNDAVTKNRVNIDSLNEKLKAKLESKPS